MSKKKPYFAQMANCDPKFHRAKHFDTFDEAKAWLDEKGGGSIKKRNAEVIHSLGYGLARVDFDKPFRTYKEIYDSEGKVEPTACTCWDCNA